MIIEVVLLLSLAHKPTSSPKTPAASTCGRVNLPIFLLSNRFTVPVFGLGCSGRKQSQWPPSVAIGTGTGSIYQTF